MFSGQSVPDQARALPRWVRRWVCFFFLRALLSSRCSWSFPVVLQLFSLITVKYRKNPYSLVVFVRDEEAISPRAKRVAQTAT